MPKDLQLVRDWKTIEREHDRRVKRSDVAMPDVSRHAGEEDVGVTAFKSAHHRHVGNGVALPEILAEKESVNARGISAYDHVLVVVGKDARLDEITRAQKVGHRARFAHRAQGALPKPLIPSLVGLLQF